MLTLSSQNRPVYNYQHGKKLVYFNNYYQTNQKLQPKPEINLKKQPEKMVEHTGQANNYQKEKNARNKVRKPKTSRQVVVAVIVVTELLHYSCNN